MKKKLKVLVDAEFMDDTASFDLRNSSGGITYSYQACGGGGGCSGGCGGGCGKVCGREQFTNATK